MSRLLLVRHGDTKLNSAERFWGQTDVELSDSGIRQAEQLRDRLATQVIHAIYASHLKRASVTAKTIASKHKLSVITCPELSEINFGLCEGLTFEEISQHYPDFVKVLLDRNISPRFPGGESLDELNTRVSKFMKRLEKHAPEETVLIVAHSGTLRLVICNLLGIGLQHWRQFRLSFASLSILETFPNAAMLNLFNDVSHLE